MNNTLDKLNLWRPALAATAIVLMFPGSQVYSQGGESENVSKSIGGEVRVYRVENDAGSHRGYIGEDELRANALGLTVAELENVYNKAFDLALEQMVADGDLTQAQADDLKEHESGYLILDRYASDEQIAQYVAQALEISPADLDGALDGAIQKAADDGLITQAQANDMLVDKLIAEKMREAREQALSQAVEEGWITRAQADNRLADMDHQVNEHHEIEIVGPAGVVRGTDQVSVECGPVGRGEGRFEFYGPGDFEQKFEQEFEYVEPGGHFERQRFRLPRIDPLR